jgi:hypothetical protein
MSFFKLTSSVTVQKQTVRPSCSILEEATTSHDFMEWTDALQGFPLSDQQCHPLGASWRNSYAAHILWVSISFVKCNCITRVMLLAILIHGTNLKYHPLCQDKCPLCIWKFLNAHLYSVRDSSGWLAWCLLQARNAQKDSTCHERPVVTHCSTSGKLLH